jgi:hypothetical protein
MAGGTLVRIKITGVQYVQIVQPLRSVQSPSFILPRDAGEDQRACPGPDPGWRFERFERFEREGIT